MKPDVARVLEHTTANLMTQVAPAIAPAYRQSSVGALGALLIGVREEFDRAAARRVEENAALRGLFARARELATEPKLAQRLDEVSGGTDADLRVPALEATNQALRELLIALHAHVESLEGDDARAIESEIWAELAASTERRQLTLSVF